MQFIPRLKKLEWLLYCLLLIFYLFLATFRLTQLPIFVDEALYLRWAEIAWHDPSWRFISLTDGKQPLYVWLVIPFMKMITDPLAAGRAASVFSGLIAVVGMGYLGYLLGTKKTAFYTTLLSIFSPYLFFYYRFGIMEATLIAGIVWVTNFSILLARYKRLDLAMLLGIITGLTLLVKSSALFFCLMIPFSYLLFLRGKKLSIRDLSRYGTLVLVSWFFAFIIYNIQRLSPWMHMIGQKNAFFTVPIRQIFDEPARITNNFFDVWRWQYHYTTLPILLAAVVGAAIMLHKNLRQFLVVSAWLIGPLLGTVLIARLFAPRYIIFVTPFIIVLAGYCLSLIESGRIRLLITVSVLVMPIILITKLLIDPIHFPYVTVDEGYVNGWSAGNGTKQIADWAVERATASGRPLKIYTEGTFGILPHGLELYVDGKTNLVAIEGVYPITTIPPLNILEAAKTNPETYLLMNNTELTNVPQTLKLVATYYKRDTAYSMRLYQVVPKP